MIIGIDHGNLQIKTAHCVFSTSIKRYPYNIDFGNVLEFKGEFYSLSPDRIAYANDKTKNKNFFILTLIALAKELDARKSSAAKVNVDLGVGLPPGEFNEQNKEEFINYFSQEKKLTFKYAGKEYNVTINSVHCYMQAYSAIKAASINEKDIKNSTAVDIGGYTVDILNFQNGEIQQSALTSLNKGIINLLNDIKATVRGFSGLILRDDDIYQVFRGEETLLGDKVTNIIKFMRDEYAEEVLHFVKEESIWDLQVNKAIFTGGGSVYLQKFFQESEELGNITFIDNVHANAIGYEHQIKETLSKEKEPEE